MIELTNRQALILSTITAFIERFGFPPTLREIGEAVRIGSNRGVETHIEALCKKQFLHVVPNQSRGIRVLKNAQGESLTLRHVVKEDSQV